MLLRPTRPTFSPAFRRGWLLALAGMAGYACAFPEYIFEADATEQCQNGILDGNEERIDCGGTCAPCPGPVCQPDDTDCQPSTCDNGVQDDMEEGVDCGGSCPLCPGRTCSHDLECRSLVCHDQDEVCVEATCNDVVKNGDETALNCGGSCPPCEDGAVCLVDADCDSNVCNGTCQKPTCDDEVKNGNETDVDCGTAVCPCPIGDICETGDNCETGYCDENELTCVAQHCANNQVDPEEGESDLNCGGPCAGCDTGGQCEGIDANCLSGVCGLDHTCLAASCSDGTQNGDETGVDCGGDPQCAKCPPGQACNVDDDCLEHVCSDGECAEPSCNDMSDNGNETDVDCGGDCDPCPAERGCLVNADCQSNHCVGICVEASCADGILNDDEVAIDCGGDCPLCGLGSACEEDANCASNLCEDECELGLTLRTGCTRCGVPNTDAFGFQIELTNGTNSEFPLSELVVRYYFSEDFETPYTPLCADCDFEVSVNEFEGGTSDATHYVEVDLSPSAETLAPGVALNAQIVVGWTADDYMNQTNDYSFRSTGLAASNSVTVHRNGVLIWGIEPISAE